MESPTKSLQSIVVACFYEMETDEPHDGERIDTSLL